MFTESLPPLQGLIPGLIGLIFLVWGWWNLRLERHMPFSGILFAAGCGLWAYACYVLIPWSVA